jgi:hypothetical protein
MGSSDLVHFQNPTDEDELCGVFKALCEEFGMDKVILACPTTWEEHVHWTPEYKIEYTTETTIVIKAYMSLKKAPVVQYEKHLAL